MLLEAILMRIHKMLETCDIQGMEFLANLLLDVHPNKPEKPRNIYVWYSSKGACVWFTFEYTDANKNRDLSYNELYQYFCTVLGEKE